MPGRGRASRRFLRGEGALGSSYACEAALGGLTVSSSCRRNGEDVLDDCVPCFPCDAEAKLPIVTAGAELSLDHNGDRPSRRSLARLTRATRATLSIARSPARHSSGHASQAFSASIDYSPAETSMVRSLSVRRAIRAFVQSGGLARADRPLKGLATLQGLRRAPACYVAKRSSQEPQESHLSGCAKSQRAGGSGPSTRALPSVCVVGLGGTDSGHSARRSWRRDGTGTKDAITKNSASRYSLKQKQVSRREAESVLRDCPNLDYKVARCDSVHDE